MQYEDESRYNNEVTYQGIARRYHISNFQIHEVLTTMELAGTSLNIEGESASSLDSNAYRKFFNEWVKEHIVLHTHPNREVLEWELEVGTKKYKNEFPHLYSVGTMPIPSPDSIEETELLDGI